MMAGKKDDGGGEVVSVKQLDSLGDNKLLHIEDGIKTVTLTYKKLES
jgi:hypothetical protein